MTLRYLFSITIITIFSFCQNAENKKQNTNTSVDSTISQTSIDSNFENFLEHFSKDSVFQLNRTVFPIKMKQYVIEKEMDTIILIPHTEFEMMNLSRKEAYKKRNDWIREIVFNSHKTKATIEIRGLENGLVVDYIFEKRNGKWMFVSIDDAST